MAIVPANGQQWTITPNDDGNMLDIGPASALTDGALVVQFNPSFEFVGSIAVRARAYGNAAKSLNMPPLAIAYKRINVNGQASDYTFVTDLITGAGLIAVPSSGLSTLLQISCNAGHCDIAIWRLNASTAV